MAGFTIGDTVPDLQLETTHGSMRLYDFIGDSWLILFSHPGDFTPVCTTELGMMAVYAEKFGERGAKLLGVSGEDVGSHKEWIKDIEEYNKGHKVEYPIIADPKRELIKQLNMVEKDNSGNNLPCRALHIIGPDKKIKLIMLYPGSTGRNMDEVVRVLEALQKSEKHKVATPANWKSGDEVVISPGVSTDEAKQMFPQGFSTAHLPSNKDYLRFATI